MGGLHSGSPLRSLEMERKLELPPHALPIQIHYNSAYHTFALTRESGNQQSLDKAL